MTSVDLFVAQLKKRGIGWMATLCGHGLNPLFDAAQRAGMRLVDTRNEQTASYVADYWGKLTGQIGVCAVSSGVAHANALTGVTNAWFDRSPMLLISGAGALRTAGLGHFQDMDQVSMAQPVTKYARVIDAPERTAEILESAIDAALEAPRGPVHLTYPMDIQTAPGGRQVAAMSAAAHRATEARFAAGRVEALLRDSKRPLIVAGSEIFYGGHAGQVLDFAAAKSIPLVIPIWDRGFVAAPHPAYCGVIGAATGGASLLKDADAVLLFGGQADYRTGYLANPRQRVLAADGGFAALGDLQSPKFESWLTESRARVEKHRAKVEAKVRPPGRAGRMNGGHVVSAVSRALAPDSLLLVDGGSIGQWTHQLLCSRQYPGHWLTCGRSGVVGWGLGGAMAARLAHPDKPVILISGDGAFTFTVAELECAVRQKLPFVAVVADDQAWGITRVGHEKEYGKAIASTLGPVAFDKLAESLGARGRRAVTPDELETEIRGAIDSGEVTVIHVPITGGNP